MWVHLMASREFLVGLFMLYCVVGVCLFAYAVSSMINSPRWQPAESQTVRHSQFVKVNSVASTAQGDLSYFTPDRFSMESHKQH